MSDFWARKLGQQNPQHNSAPARPAPAQPAQRPWWDQPSTAERFHAAGEAAQQAQLGQQGVHPLAQDPGSDYRPQQAKSARMNDTCPSCSSGNYMAPPNSNTQMRCFDCGYPYEQTGSAGISTQGGTPATPARQIHDGSSNYNPGTIIGRIQ